MERTQWRTIVGGVGLAAAVVALVTGRSPRWLRAALVLGIVILACGSGLYAYHYFTRPTTLTVAAGSSDGAAVQLMSTIAARLASTGAPVRLNVTDTGDTLESANTFSAGKTDLAVTRPDIGNLSSAETVVVVTRAAVLIIVPPGSSITEMDELKGKTVGVFNGEVNYKVAEALNREYGLDKAQTHFKNLALKDIAPAVKSKQVQAMLVVIPVVERYLAMLRGLFPRTGKQKPTLIPIESAAAIAEITKYYQSYDLPKGAVQGSPPIPDEDMKTLRVPYYLVANKKLSDEVVGSLARAIMDARRDLIGEYPDVAQISEPNTDKTDSNNDTYIAVHPGAAAYFSGTQQSFLDKYANQIFIGSTVLGSLISFLAAAWHFIMRDTRSAEDRPLMRLSALTDQIDRADSETQLAELERRMDDILKGELGKSWSAGTETKDTAALALAIHRLECLLARRRILLSQ